MGTAFHARLPNRCWSSSKTNRPESNTSYDNVTAVALLVIASRVSQAWRHNIVRLPGPYSSSVYPTRFTVIILDATPDHMRKWCSADSKSRDKPMLTSSARTSTLDPGDRDSKPSADQPSHNYHIATE
jgi:hypothetical protein